VRILRGRCLPGLVRGIATLLAELELLVGCNDIPSALM
jgi:hypothetical protein